MMQMGLKIASGCDYSRQLLRQGRELEYFGARVTADDAEAVLMRWKLEGGGAEISWLGILHTLIHLVTCATTCVPATRS